MEIRIRKIEIFQVDLPLVEGSYKWSGGNSVEILDSTIVAVHTDQGLVGYGEVCPLGPAYLPAFAQGARTAIAQIAPAILGVDPTKLSVVNDRMDQSLRGHAYAKSALDVACWDLLGQVAGLPLVTLLGGRRGDSFALYRAISQDSPSEMGEKVVRYRAEGYSKFQLKVGGDPEVDFERIRIAASAKKAAEVRIADANTGWSQHEAPKRVR